MLIFTSIYIFFPERYVLCGQSKTLHLNSQLYKHPFINTDFFYLGNNFDYIRNNIGQCLFIFNLELGCFLKLFKYYIHILSVRSNYISAK